jgi:uncharacterized protein (DUF736 family)
VKRRDGQYAFGMSYTFGRAFRHNENAPAFHVLFGRARVGEAWEARSVGTNAKNFLRVKLDDPSLIAPMSAALFPSENGAVAELVWSRRREMA